MLLNTMENTQNNESVILFFVVENQLEYIFILLIDYKNEGDNILIERSEYIEIHKNLFVEKIADNMRTFGVSETIGRVLGIIYMNREPMTLDELSAATGLSKMRMSQVVREMIELNIAKKVFKKGVRKDLIQVEDDYYQTFVSLFTSNWRKAVLKSRHFERKRRNELSTLEINESHSNELLREKERLTEELNEWSNYYDWINRLIDFFESGDVFKHVPINERGNKNVK